MNIKRTSIFAGAIGGFAIVGSAVAGMNGITYDLEGEDLIAGTYTVRVYAELEAGNRLDAVFGNQEFNMTLDYLDGASAYQNGYGGPTSQNINSAFFTAFPSLEWDSYVTIGALYVDGTPFGSNALMDIGIDWTDFEAGGAIYTDNGTWFATPDDPQVLAGADLRVMVGQFTMYGLDSHVSGVLNIQGKAGDFETFQEREIVFDFPFIPAPGALALLGIAGLAQRRRK